MQGIAAPLSRNQGSVDRRCRFRTLNDVAIRWSALPIDVVDSATDGLLMLSTAIPPVKTIFSRMICDLVNVAATDIRPPFRPDGARSDAVSVRRVREPGESEWQWISEPAGGIAITAPEVLITREKCSGRA